MQQGFSAGWVAEMAVSQSLRREASFSEYSFSEYSFSEYSFSEYSLGEYSFGEYSSGKTLIESAVENRSQGQISPNGSKFPQRQGCRKVTESEVCQNLPCAALAWSGR